MFCLSLRVYIYSILLESTGHIVSTFYRWTLNYIRIEVYLFIYSPLLYLFRPLVIIIIAFLAVYYL